MYVQFKGISKKGQAIFRLSYDGPKRPDGSRNQKKETYNISPKPEEAAALIKAAENRAVGQATATEKKLLERFEKKALKAAEDYARDKEKEINKPNYIEPTGETFKEHAERWLKYRAGRSRNGKMQPKTMLRYEQLLERINEYLGAIEITAINNDRVEEFYEWLTSQKKKIGGNFKDKKKLEERAELKEKDAGYLSRQTLWHYHRCLYSVLEYAVARKLLESNPAKYVHPEAPESQDEKKVDSYTAEEVQQIKAELQKEGLQHQVLVLLALETGARVSEILALKWADIDIESRLLNINKALQYAGPELGTFEKAPKNKTSIRKVRLSAEMIFLLRQLKGEQEAKAEERGSKWQNSGVLFTSWDGSQVNGHWGTNWWRGWIRESGLPVKTFHSLRHSCISLLMAAGANPLEVARMVGHSNAEMLWRVYGHATEKEAFAGADLMAQIMSGKNDKDMNRVMRS